MRFTRQRRHIYDLLSHSRDHPTAEELFDRAKRSMPEISFATVYNTLSALVHCGLVRQVTLNRAPTRFCSNMKEHCHFYCEVCGEVSDIELKDLKRQISVLAPEGYQISQSDISIRGVCPKCGARSVRS